MTFSSFTDPREASQAHLEIAEYVLETLQETYPAAAKLQCHQQMRDILTRIRYTFHHPVLFAAHIVVYLLKAIRFSRRWATLIRRITALDPLLSSAHARPSHPSYPPHSSHPSDPSNLSAPSTPCASSHSSSFILPPSSFHHSLPTRLRIRAFAQALQHERHLAQTLPPSIPKPDLTPILPTPRHHPSIPSPQSAIPNPQSSILSPQHSALSPLLHSPLFPSEGFWTSKVQSLQLRLLGNLTRALRDVILAWLKQYQSSTLPTQSTLSISSTQSTSSTPSTSSIPSFSSHSSHPSYPSHSSPPHSLLSSRPQASSLKPQVSGLFPQHSALSSHPPPKLPSET